MKPSRRGKNLRRQRLQTFTAKTPMTPMLKFKVSKDALEKGWTDPLRSNISMNDPSIQPDFIIPSRSYESRAKKKRRPATASKRRMVINTQQRWFQRSKRRNEMQKTSKLELPGSTSRIGVSKAYIKFVSQQQHQEQENEPADTSAAGILKSLPKLRLKLERFTRIQNSLKLSQLQRHEICVPDAKPLEAMIAKFREDQKALEKQLDDFLLQSLNSYLDHGEWTLSGRILMKCLMWVNFNLLSSAVTSCHNLTISKPKQIIFDLIVSDK